MGGQEEAFKDVSAKSIKNVDKMSASKLSKPMRI